ncbi:MAG: SMP-30/gluconolactonase/LRE family protein [Deltaproteobacteria bacterium]|jgi:hypothetical protein|nr:SMP-30/gluconolactonase/LRE family protein [Deltaproteobacteria bacterium]
MTTTRIASRVPTRALAHPAPPSFRILCASLLAWALAAAPALGEGDAGDAECAARDNARPVCGFQNPEDLVVLPGEAALLVSEYGRAAGGRAGRLALFVLADDARHVVFEGGRAPAEAMPGWGDPECQTPPSEAFSPHGIDLVRRDDGRLALLVIQHGDREAVEHFEVQGEGQDWQLSWRGCVAAPDDASLNDVIAFPDGRFYATKMMSLGHDARELFAMPTEPTGEVHAWTPGQGYAVIPGTRAMMPNGLEASPDGAIVYMNASGEGVIRKVEAATGRELGRAEVVSPDNVTWAPDGQRLLIASLMPAKPEVFEACQKLTRGACGVGFSIVAVDAATMKNEGAIYTSDGSPMGAGTVGLQVGNELFVGSFAGDRILRVDLGGS